MTKCSYYYYYYYHYYICYYYYICQRIAESFSHRTCPPEREVLNSNQGLGGDGRDLSTVRVAIYDTGCLFFLLFLFFLLPTRDHPFVAKGHISTLMAASSKFYGVV